jgi:multidrug efflux pump subunit AcrA (membrane-fusion protein)
LFVVLIGSKPTAKSTAITESATHVDAISVNLAALHPSLRLYATLSSPSLAKISAAIEANVSDTPFKPGDEFLPSQVLLSLDQRDAQLNLQQREAELADIQAQIEVARNNAKNAANIVEQEQLSFDLADKAVNRVNALQHQSLESAASLEDAKQQRLQKQLSLYQSQTTHQNQGALQRQLAAKQSQAESRLAAAKLNLERSRIQLPYHGRVTALHVAQGERVRAGSQLLEAYDLGQLELRAQIPSRYLPVLRQSLKQGQSLHALAVMEGVRIPLTLVRIGAAVTTGNAAVDIYFSPQTNGLQDFPLGSVANVQLQLPAVERAFALPADSLYGTNSLYKIVDNRLQLIRVERHGAYDDQGRLIFSSNEVSSGDQILTSKFANAMDGIKVDIRER